MKIQIRNRYTNQVIIEGEYKSIKDLLEKNKRADLSGTYLSEADLYGADLHGVNLREADLSEADLSGSNLRGANLSEADLSGTYLSEADLSRAYLSGAKITTEQKNNIIEVLNIKII